MNIASQLLEGFCKIRCHCEGGDGNLCDTMNCVCAISELREIIKDTQLQKLGYKNLYFLSIYSGRDVYEKGSLHEFDPPNSQRSLKRDIRKTKLENFKALGFLDLMYREFIGRAYGAKSQWCLHYHLLCTSDNTKQEIVERLQDVVARSPYGRKPVVIKEVYGDIDYLVAYIFKYNEFLKKKIHDGTKQISRTYPISGPARLELENFLLQVKPTERIISIGM